MINSEEINPSSYDLVVIGGGINGAAVARDAALRGLKVILLEKTDFGSGASTKTSKLAHGGLRYLEQYDFSLVKESLHERNLLLKNAPHLVHPLKFVYPIYKDSIRPLWQVDLGLYLYDFFARRSGLPCHKKLSKDQIVDEFSGIHSEELLGGCSYFDAQMKDHRLLIENIVAAEQAGATICNYAPVTQLLWNQGKIDGVVSYSINEKIDTNIKCKLVVNTTGAWSNEIADLVPGTKEYRVVPTKGIHLVLPKMFENALILRAPQDGRIFFVLPWQGYSLIGATDTFYAGTPENVSIDQSDVDYLLEAFNHHFPDIKITQNSIISSFVGLRPLVGNHQSKNPSLISRDHTIQFSESGLITVLGGKYTTHRQMAEEVVDMIVGHLKQKEPSKIYKDCCTQHTLLPGAIQQGKNLENEFSKVGLNTSQIEYLLQNYGQLAAHILEIIRLNPLESQQICPGHPHILAELSYAIQFEHVKCVDDWLYRRTSIAYTQGEGKICKSIIDQKLGFDLSKQLL